MPIPTDEETNDEIVRCLTSGCEYPGEYANDYRDGLFCEPCNDSIIDRYYESDDDNNDEVSCDSICSPVGFSRLGNTGVFIYVGAPTLFAKDDINSITLLSFKSYENPAAKISLKS